MDRQDILNLIAQFSASQQSFPAATIAVCASEPDSRGHVMLVTADGRQHHVKAKQAHAPWFRPRLGSSHDVRLDDRENITHLYPPNPHDDRAEIEAFDPETCGPADETQPISTVRITGAKPGTLEALGLPHPTPAVLDVEATQWSLERWDRWAMDLLGLEGKVEAHGRQHMREQIAALLPALQTFEFEGSGETEYDALNDAREEAKRAGMVWHERAETPHYTREHEDMWLCGLTITGARTSEPSPLRRT